VLIYEKELEEREARGLLDGGGKRTPSLVNLPPTTLRPSHPLTTAHYG